MHFADWKLAGVNPGGGVDKNGGGGGEHVSLGSIVPKGISHLITENRKRQLAQKVHRATH